LKMALLSKKTRGAKVVVRMTFRFGDEQSLMNRSTAGDMAGQMLMRGTTKHTRQQIQDEFDRLKARASVFGGATQAGASIETVHENLPAVLKLATEVLREPSFPASEFELLKQEQLAAVEQQRSEPDSVAEIEFSRHMNPYPKGDVRYEMTVDETIAALKTTTLEEAKSFYKDFYGASNAEVAVVGDFDETEISQLMKSLLGDWKSPRPYDRVVDVYHDVSPIDKSLETPDKANAVFLAGVNLSLRDDDPNYPALIMGNYMLGGASNSRLRLRIRSKEGISYSVGSQLSASPLDKDGSFQAFAIYAPENLSRLEAAFREEVNQVLKSGFTPDEVKLAKTGYLQSRQVSRAQDNELAGRLATYLFLDRTLNWDSEFEQKINALTPEQISDAMRQWIDPAKLSVVKAGDFAKIPK
jgi:zinc protease